MALQCAVDSKLEVAQFFIEANNIALETPSKDGHLHIHRACCHCAVFRAIKVLHENCLILKRARPDTINSNHPFENGITVKEHSINDEIAASSSKAEKNTEAGDNSKHADHSSRHDGNLVLPVADLEVSDCASVFSLPTFSASSLFEASNVNENNDCANFLMKKEQLQKVDEKGVIAHLLKTLHRH